MAENGKNGGVGYPLATVLTIIGMITGGLATFYGTRDQALASARTEIAVSATAVRAEYREALSHYLTREQFAQWREANGARRDEQYYGLLNALQRVGAKLQR